VNPSIRRYEAVLSSRSQSGMSPICFAVIQDTGMWPVSFDISQGPIAQFASALFALIGIVLAASLVSAFAQHPNKRPSTSILRRITSAALRNGAVTAAIGDVRSPTDPDTARPVDGFKQPASPPANRLRPRNAFPKRGYPPVTLARRSFGV
jgi:hypothetical protein